MTIKVHLALVKALLSLQESGARANMQLLLVMESEIPHISRSAEELGTRFSVEHFGLSCQSERHIHDYTTSDTEGTHG